MSLTRGIDNLKEYMSPLTILQKRLDRENIVKNQKKNNFQISIQSALLRKILK
jgi:hypothetical protein